MSGVAIVLSRWQVVLLCASFAACGLVFGVVFGSALQ
jgi:hypothetical protein